MDARRILIILIPILALAFFFLYPNMSQPEPREDESSITRLLYISGDLAECNEPTGCLQIKQSPADDYEVFESEIEGLSFVPGIEQRVLVTETEGNYSLQSILGEQRSSVLAANPEAFEIETREDIPELDTKILQPGEGEEVLAAGQTVTVHYRGWIASTGVEFDSSIGRGTPATFGLDALIEGWKLGMPGMKLGEVRRVYIPSDLGYGEVGSASIPANSDIIFDVELLAIE